MQRNREVSIRTPENLGFQRAYVIETLVRKWFHNLKIFLMEQHDLDVNTLFTTENAERIFTLTKVSFLYREQTVGSQ